MKNKSLYNLSFRANSSLGLLLADGHFPIPILRPIPIPIPILNFNKKIKTTNLCD
jgi:hypothetical protein